jgi:hypothetical protein
LRLLPFRNGGATTRSGTSAGVRVWLITGFVFAGAFQLLEDYIWIAVTLPLGAWVITGIALFIRHLFRLPALDEPYSRYVNLGAIVAGLALFIPFASLGSAALERVRFAWHRSDYERVVAAVQSGTTSDTGLHYTVDPGPPARVAFPWPGGVIDNWCGVVFDPTAAVLEVNALQMGSPRWRAASVTKLFGGDMTACRLLSKTYYLCCFT